MRLVLSAVVVCVLGLGGSASAATVDFTTPGWVGGYGYGGGQLNYKYETAVGKITVGSWHGGLEFSGHGASVGSPWDLEDAISGREFLSISFDDGPLFVESVQLGQFGSGDAVSIRGDGFSHWALDGFNVGADGMVELNRSVSHLRLSGTAWTDFSLRAISATSAAAAPPIPEPTSLILFPAGALLVGYTVWRRRGT